jgi:hypothetical protein
MKSRGNTRSPDRGADAVFGSPGGKGLRGVPRTHRRFARGTVLTPKVSELFADIFFFVLLLISFYIELR